MKNIKLNLFPKYSVISSTIIIFIIFIFFNPLIAQTILEDTTTYDLPDGFSRTKVISDFELNKGQLIATLFKMEKIQSCKIKFVSRKNFREDFNFENIEKQCRNQNEQIVMQVASAFTPDWKGIEGFALQDGQSVGEDTCLGENKKLIYGGLLLIKDGYPVITNLDNISDKAAFVANAIKNKYSLFQQVAAIINGKINSKVNLPGIHKRRFFIEITEDHETKFGIVSFIIPMKYSDAVSAIKLMGKDTFIVNNALYLDMGSVSEGYFYDSKGNEHLIGDPHANVENYTNVLVMYKNIKLK